MTEQETQEELLTRFELVERMVKEGRRSTEYWGWTFVLWGTAYLLATGWSYWFHMAGVAWSVTMIAAVLITVAVIQAKKKRGMLSTTLSRSIISVWNAVGIALMIFCFSASLSGHAESHTFVAAIECFLGVANFASSQILRWPTQLFVALLWWVSAAATCFAPETAVAPIFIGATLIGMIGFGLYLMYCEHRDRRALVQHA
jgi:hypothetical protein